MFYHIEKGPLTALKWLLATPLEFDAKKYLECTTQLSARSDIVALKELVDLFESTKISLFPKAPGVPLLLLRHKKLGTSNYISEHSYPITWRMLDAAEGLSTNDGLVGYQIDGLNLQIDRLLETFNVRECAGETSMISELGNFISFYYLSEVLFFTLSGIAKVEKKSEEFIVEPSDQNAVRSLHRKWFGNYWESCSSQANLAYIDALPGDAIQDSLFFNIIDLIGKGLRDKVFSIPWKDYSDRLEKSDSVDWMGKISTIVALCLWCQLKGKMEYVPAAMLKKIGVDHDDLEQLRSLHVGLSEPDRVFRFNGGDLKLINPSFTHQLRRSINDLCSILAERDLNQILGDYFEKDYLKQYFKNSLNEERKNYEVHEGLLDHEIAKGDKTVDVDFIVEDLRRNRFIFVQVKYLRIGGKAYMLGDVEHMISGKLTKGISQIEAAKDLHAQGKLAALLADRGIQNCVSTNSTFVVVHNISNFDFQITSSGVCMYEWNTLRNLLQDGRCTFGHSRNAPEDWKYREPMPIEDPDQVMEILIKNSPVCLLGGGDRIFRTDKMASSAQFLQNKVTCIGI